MATQVREKQAAKHDAFITEQIARAEQRIRLIDLASALGGWLAGSLGYAILLIVLDRSFVLSAGTRQTLFLGYVVASLIYLFRTMVQPLRWRVNPYYAARQLEHSIGGKRNHVINWIDLHEQQVPGVLRQVLGQRAAKDLSQADIDQAISGRRLLVVGVVTALLFVLFMTLFLILGPGPFSSLLGRAFAPFGKGKQIATRTQVAILLPKGGDSLATIGMPVTIVAEVSGRVPDAHEKDAPCLLYRHDERESYRKRFLQREENGQEWVTTISPLDVGNGFFYKVTAGDAETPEYRVSVRAAPLIRDFVATYRYRPYVQRADRSRITRKLEDLRGTDVLILARTNRTVKEGLLHFVGQDGAGDLQRAEVQADDPQALRFRMRLERSGQYRIRFTSSEGETYQDPVPHEVIVLDDLAPEVQLTHPGKDVNVPANGTLELKGELSDDHGIAQVELQVQVVDGPRLRGKPYLSDKLGKKDFGTPKILQYRDYLSMTSLKDQTGKPFEPRTGMQLEYWLEAQDACDVPGPNKGKSKHYRIVMTDPVANAEQKKQQHQAQKKQEQHEQEQGEKLRQEQQQREEQRQREQEQEKQEGQARQQQQQKGEQTSKEGGESSDKQEKQEGGEKGGKKEEPQEKQKGQKEDPRDEQTRQQAEQLKEALQKKEQGNRSQEKEKPSGPGEAKGTEDNKPGQNKEEAAQDQGKPGQSKEQGNSREASGEQKEAGEQGANQEKGQARQAGKSDPTEGQGEGKEGDKQNSSGAGQGKPGEASKPRQGETKEAGDPKQAQQAGENKVQGEGTPSEKQPQGQAKESGSAGKSSENSAGESKEGAGKGAAEKKAEAKAGGNTSTGSEEKSPSAGKPGEKGNKAGKSKDGEQTGRAGNETGKVGEKKGNGEDQGNAQQASKQDVERLAKELQSGGKEAREKAQRELTDIRDQASDAEAREAARQALEKAREGEAPGRDKPMDGMGKGTEGQPGETKQDAPAPQTAGTGKSAGEKSGKPGEGEKGASPGAKEGAPSPRDAKEGPGKNKGTDKGQADTPGEGLSGDRQAGTGQAGGEGQPARPEKPERHRPSMLQLEEFRKKVDPQVLKDAKMSPEQFEQFLKDYAELARRQQPANEEQDTPPPAGRSSTLPSMGGKTLQPGGAGSTTEVRSEGRPKPPPEYREAQNEFLRRLLDRSK